MRTKTIEIYTFEELSEDTRDIVRNNFRQMPDLWSWQDDWGQSAQAFSRIAPIDIRDADYDRAQVSIRWTDSDEIAELSGLRGWKWLLNNEWFQWALDNKKGACTMTGFCADCLFADAIAQYESNPLATPELKQVFYEAAQSWVYGARSDMEYAYSNQAIDDMIECNEYEFYANGEFAQ